MRAASTKMKFLGALVAVAALAPLESRPAARVAAPVTRATKLDSRLQSRAHLHSGRTQVIVRAARGASLSDIAPVIEQAGGRLGRRLSSDASHVAVVPNALLQRLAASPFVERISLDREVTGTMERTGLTIGATAVRQELGFDGSGVGVAIVDSGIAPWHDDLADGPGGPRVAQFVDFLDGGATAYDDYGHGTHVAGIVAGNGFDSGGARMGIAPGAHLIVLKTLDATGKGRISDVIAAIDYAIDHRDELNIRVINLSVASGVYESYTSDPLTLAAQRAVNAGIVVVAAAGNNGRSFLGRTQYGGITAPGNAPWVLTVGASSHMGTPDRGDDTIAAFTSRGPTAVDHQAKPDVVAPGVGIESLADPGSSLYASSAAYLLNGTVPTAYAPYLSLTGTSMSVPVVSGTVALMFHANARLTPNQVKAILQYTAQVYPGYDPLTEGAGFLNARGAVELAQYLASPSTNTYPDHADWGARLMWGNRQVRGGTLTADANAWPVGVTWGASTTADSKTIWFGLSCSNASCNSTTDARWRADKGSVQNVVWGSLCGGSDCSGTAWTVEAVSGASWGETVVWGTSNAETVVWGTTGGETVVWGTERAGETVVWGTAIDGETVVWGTSADTGTLRWQATTVDGTTVVWGTVIDGEAIPLGTVEGGETVVWGTACGDPSCIPIIWGDR